MSTVIQGSVSSDDMGKDFLSIRLITPQDNNNKDMLKMREH